MATLSLNKQSWISHKYPVYIKITDYTRCSTECAGHMCNTKPTSMHAAVTPICNLHVFIMYSLKWRIIDSIDSHTVANNFLCWLNLC